MILSTLDKSRKGGAYEQIPSLVLGQRWTPQLNSRNMMKVVLCVWIEPYIENDLFFLRLACPYTYDLEGGLNFVGINQSPALHRK